MQCRYINDISDKWVEEKRDCINPREKLMARRIENLFRNKIETDSNYFAPEEFAEFLRFKGLARSMAAFLKEYNNKSDVKKVTGALFTSELIGLTFAEVQNESSKNKILGIISDHFHHLQQLKYVGPGVASACLALCFPEICGTADYIVPALLHNEYDSLDNKNPLFANQDTAQEIRKALLLPVDSSLSASGARFFATQNYTIYIQELWNFKRLFNLTHPLRGVEEALWSFGICYIKKNGENKPLMFKSKPHPPKGGPFSKNCP
jgi:hypothetical protein